MYLSLFAGSLGVILITRTTQPIAIISIVYFDTQIMKYLLGRGRLLQGRSVTSYLVLFMSGHLSIPYDAKSVFKV